MYTLMGFADHLLYMAGRSDQGGKRLVTEACETIKAEAQRVLGTYDYGWEPLKEKTIRRKATGDSPLLETGELRDSIQISVTQSRTTLGRFGHGFAGEVFSDNPKAVWHELGTLHISARPFLSGAAQAVEKEVVNKVGEGFFKNLVGG